MIAALLHLRIVETRLIIGHYLYEIMHPIASFLFRPHACVKSSRFVIRIFYRASPIKFNVRYNYGFIYENTGITSCV